MGSKEIRKLGIKKAFSFIGISGRNQVWEKRADKSTEEVSVSQVFAVNSDFVKPETSVSRDVSFLTSTIKAIKHALSDVIDLAAIPGLYAEAG